MEHLIEEIKSVYAKNGCFPQNEVEKYLNLFRERGTSVMALEELLSYYSNKHSQCSGMEEEAFVDPSMAMQTSYDVICQQISQLEDKNSQLSKCLDKMRDELRKKQLVCNLLSISLGFCLIVLIVLIAFFFVF